MTRTLKLTIAYDGTAYVGWQRQANGVSVQALIEDAFAPLLGVRPTVAGAGRTDAGVHALGQVASVVAVTDVPASAIQRALNARLPGDVRVLGVVDAAPGFHARVHATGKSYRYRIATTPVVSPFERWFVWHAPQSLNLTAMRAGAAALVGRHDFAAFQAAGSSVTTTVRTIERVDIVDAHGEVRIEVEGDGFLRHMVRTIAGTLVEIGAGQRAAEQMPAILDSRIRHAAGQTAPALGLTLVAVRYHPG